MERDVLEPKDWRVDMLVKERRADTRPQVEPERRGTAFGGCDRGIVAKESGFELLSRRSHPVHHLLSFLEKCFGRRVCG